MNTPCSNAEELVALLGVDIAERLAPAPAAFQNVWLTPQVLCAGTRGG